MFRRGYAAISLGKNDLAYWDLYFAHEIDPSNQEVSKKFDQVKKLLHSISLNENSPVGLGVGLPSHEKKPMNKNICPPSRENEDHVSFDTKDPKCGKNDGNAMEETFENKHEREQSPCTSCENEEASIQSNGKPKEVYSPVTSSPSCLTNVPISVKNENVNLAKPNYQFHNRRRQGSFLSISKKDYHLMTQGKTLEVFNASSGSFMEVRIANMLDENEVSKKNGNRIHERVCSTQSNYQSRLEEELLDNADNMEALSEASSCLTHENQQMCEETSSPPRADSGLLPQDSMVPHFCFSAKPKNKTSRRGFELESHGSSQPQTKNIKRGKKIGNKKTSSFPTNLDCACSFEARRRRKCSYPPLLDFSYHPRKKSATHVCYSYISDVHLVIIGVILMPGL